MSPSSGPPPFSLPPHPTLNTPRHIRYFLRHLKTLLPTHYQSSESQRLSFAYFALSALDVLGELHATTTPREREEWADWIYTLQHPGGGFKGFTGANIGDAWHRHKKDVEEGRSGEDDDDDEEGGNIWDPANLGATFFALGSLIVLGDGMERVRLTDCLRWLKRLQRPEGNFGEALGKGGRIEGGGDVRFCYLAAGVRWILRRGPEMEERVEDVDVGGLVGYVGRCVTYDGGIAEAPGHEAHAGETFCGVAALKLLGELPASIHDENKSIQAANIDINFVENVTRWLISRQTLQLYEEGEEEEEDEDDDNEGKGETQNGMAFTSGFQVRGAHPVKTESLQPALPPSARIEMRPEQLLRAGFNGRPNKVADTCYAWWVIGALGVLGRTHFQHFNAAERYLLEKTQHQIGGFSKMPGDQPDIMHSYLGLAALAAMKHPGLNSIDSRLCMSVSAIEYFEQNTALGRGAALKPTKVAETI